FQADDDIRDVDVTGVQTCALPIYSVPDASADQVWVAGRANLFPQNLGAEGARLEIYEVDPVTGVRLGDSPLYVRDIDDSGDFGPFAVSRGASIEYVLMQGESKIGRAHV